MRASSSLAETLKTVYKGIGGEYYAGEDAWEYIREFMGVDLLKILSDIADSRETS